MNEQLPPQNIEAEEALIGGILLDPQAIEQIVSVLVAEAFYVKAHQDIYRAMLVLHNQGKPTDLMAVTVWLSDRDELDKVGGMAKLAQLLNRTVSAANIDRYANLIMDKYLRRKLISSGHSIVELGYETSSELDDVLNKSEQKLFALSNQRISVNTEHSSEITVAAFNELEENSPIYPTGLYDLDRLMAGFEPGTLTLVAGRPSMGKSQIALFLALSMILNHDLPVLFFSLEMTKTQLIYRLWSLISALDCYKNRLSKSIASNRIRQHRAGSKGDKTNAQ
jgi:replicative DNA helicase